MNLEAKKGIHIIINGYPQSGKDTFVEFCREVCPSLNVYNYSSVDMVKAAAQLLGWDGVKDEFSRNMLSVMKEFSTHYDGPMEYMKYGIKAFTPPYLAFFHIREPEEIERAKREFPLITFTMLIKRPCLKQFSNSSDSNVEKFKYDFIIENDHSLDVLYKKAENFILSF